MSLLKRLLTRPSSEARATSQPRTERPDEPAAASTKVPADHEVTTFQSASEPVVDRLPGGTVIAQLGTSSDEYLEELQQVSEEVDDLLQWYGASPVPIILADRMYQVIEHTPTARHRRFHTSSCQHRGFSGSRAGGWHLLC